MAKARVKTKTEKTGNLLGLLGLLALPSLVGFIIYMSRRKHE